MHKKIVIILWFVSFLICPLLSFSQPVEVTREPVLIGRSLMVLEDKEGTLTFDQVKNAVNYVKLDNDVPNLGTSSSVFWLKFDITSPEQLDKIKLNVAAPVLDEISFYYPDSAGNYQHIDYGENFPFKVRKYKEESYLFDLQVSATPKTYYLRIRSGEQLLLPIYVGGTQKITESQDNRRTLFGMYAGIILVMFFYNLFILYSTRDKSYLWYVLHTLFVGLTQASLQGYAFQYLWPGSPWLAKESIFLFTCLVSLAGIEFLKVFLHTRDTAPRWMHKGLHVFSGLYVLYIILSFAGIHATTYGMILGTQSLVAVYILTLGIVVYRRGFAPAKFYLIAWGSLMLGILIYVMMNFGALPYNLFTNSTLLIGSALEVALLSFALANKINLLTRENQENQRKVLEAVKENERIVREQNILLEGKVEERTSELNRAMNNLKNAQSKLVDAEKMSSLGQLTAGIAHEINNPVNFITSNIKPLHRDITDVLELVKMYEEVKPEKLDDQLKEISNFKKEIDFDFVKEEINLLIKTIDDGAQRTSEIVKGLRNFSRVDEQDLKRGDIHVGLDSTLMLLRNKLDNVNVIKNYGDIPEIDCFMGKLNQVFMNIIGNAIHAIKANRANNPKGVLTITTANAGDNITISIKDNGIGMDEKTKAKIFEPFFTTKDVGQGTGLGLSIVFNIIQESHHGKIVVNSSPGEGAEFVITLPKVHADAFR